MSGLPSRLRYLRSREALATLVLPLLIGWKWWDTEGGVAWALRVPALVLLVFILAQGTLYWHLKLGAIAAQAPLPGWFGPLFRAFRLANLTGIAAVLALLLAADRLAASSADKTWCAILLAGAVLEQINYYHVQLMYDTRAALEHLRRQRRLRKAALAVDLLRAGAR